MFLSNNNDVAAKVLDCDMEEREFELQSGYCVHFWTNALGKSMRPLILQQ